MNWAHPFLLIQDVIRHSQNGRSNLTEFSKKHREINEIETTGSQGKRHDNNPYRIPKPWGWEWEKENQAFKIWIC